MPGVIAEQSALVLGAQRILCIIETELKLKRSTSIQPKHNDPSTAVDCAVPFVFILNFRFIGFASSVYALQFCITFSPRHDAGSLNRSQAHTYSVTRHIHIIDTWFIRKSMRSTEQHQLHRSWTTISSAAPLNGTNLCEWLKSGWECTER